MSEDENSGVNRRSVIKKAGTASMAGFGVSTFVDDAAAAPESQDHWDDAELKRAEDAIAEGQAVLRSQPGDVLAEKIEERAELQREPDHAIAWDLQPKNDQVRQYDPSLVLVPFAPTAGPDEQRAEKVGTDHFGGIIAVVGEVDGERVPTAAFGIDRAPASDVTGDRTGSDRSVVRERVLGPESGGTIKADRRRVVETGAMRSASQVGDCAFCTALVSTACLFLSTVDDAACLYYCYSLSAVPPAALTCSGICAALILSSAGSALVCSAGTALAICAGAGYC